jgi:hypothetical protein
MMTGGLSTWVHHRMKDHPAQIIFITTLIVLNMQYCSVHFRQWFCTTVEPLYYNGHIGAGDFVQCHFQVSFIGIMGVAYH